MKQPQQAKIIKIVLPFHEICKVEEQVKEIEDSIDKKFKTLGLPRGKPLPVGTRRW
jgi:hypothetical protein